MFRPASSPPGIPTLILLTGLSVLTLNMFLPSLPAMAEDFGVSYARISLAVSGYFALTAIAQLFIGPLSDRFGRRPLMLGGIAIFSLASLVCTLAQNDSVFLAARVVQCAVVVGSALSPAIVRDMSEPAESARIMGVIGTVMALAPMLGPMAGGLMEALAGWRTTFGLYTLLGVVALWLTWRDLGESNTATGRPIAQQFRAYPHLFRSGRFWANAVCLAFSAGTFFVFLSGAPLVAATHFGLSPLKVGLAMAAAPLGYMIGNLVTSKLAGRLPLAIIMVIGRTITFSGMLIGLFAALNDPAPALYFGLMASIGLGNGLSFPTGYAGVMSVRPDLAGSAAGLSGSIMMATGALVTSLVGRLLVPETALVTLIVLLLCTSGVAVVAALFARRAEKAVCDLPLETTTETT